MTIKNDIILWDDGANCLCLLSIPSEQQYKYIDGLPVSLLEYLMKMRLSKDTIPLLYLTVFITTY